MAKVRLIEVGLSLNALALGERDRLLTAITPEEGVTRLVAPGARRPGSSLPGAAPCGNCGFWWPAGVVPWDGSPNWRCGGRLPAWGNGLSP